MHSVTNAIPTGTIASIPAKALAHRALICAALASSPSTILLSRTSKDIDATMDSLRGLGAHVVYENKVVTVTPVDTFGLNGTREVFVFVMERLFSA